ncbi:MAG TPA: MlaD family protein [Pseudonocardia sp.]|jgi:phospholipid/cholesterol/gamma-HCH transport system substrate-binding protein
MSKLAGGVVAAIVAALLITGGIIVAKSRAYHVTFAMPSAAQLSTGSPVLIRGFQVGKISSMEVRDNVALVGVTISGDDVPLHQGTTTSVEWAAALGERLLELFPGPPSNAEVPSGGLITGASRQTEVDQVLSALDPPTRAKLTSMLRRLNGTSQGEEQNLKAMLQSAGPTVSAVGEVLKGVGQDGPAIRALVSQMHNLIGTAVNRQNQIRGVINNLYGLTSTAASQQQQFADGLRELPSTLQTAQVTLDKVHPATDATVPLLHDLRPGISKLVWVSRDLSPLMHDLRPAARRLVPTVRSLEDVLSDTPRLFDLTHGDFPAISDILHDYQPAASFIRPYTPELAGWISNFGEAFSRYDSQGHYWGGLLAENLAAFSDTTVRLPGQQLRGAPKPGSVVNQSWDDPDATGSEPR